MDHSVVFLETAAGISCRSLNIIFRNCKMREWIEQCFTLVFKLYGIIITV